jgi:hypothetical protein
MLQCEGRSPVQWRWASFMAEVAPEGQRWVYFSVEVGLLKGGCEPPSWWR